MILNMKKISFNSPVILSFALISLGSLIAGYLTHGASTALLFSVYRGSLKDPLFYVRLFTHVLGHADYGHYVNNMLLFLLLGPILEEKYGSRTVLEVIGVTAFITGLAHILLSTSSLLGASGVEVAYILLASVTGTGKGIPVTTILVAFLYIGQQIYDGVMLTDSISQLTHIRGGAVGAVYGLALKK